MPPLLVGLLQAGRRYARWATDKGGKIKEKWARTNAPFE